MKDPVERSLLLLADLLVNNELYSKTPGDREKQLEFIWKLIDVDLHKSLSRKAGSAADKALRAAAAAAVQGYGPEELDKLAEHLAALYQKSPTVGDPPQSQIDHRARVLKTFYNECKNRKDHLLDEINILRRDPPKGAVQASTERAQQIGTNFVTAINDLNIPAFLTAVHAIGQINDSAELAAIHRVIKSTKFDQDFQVFNIRRLNAVMASVNSKLTRDKDFHSDSQEKIKQLYHTWLDLRNANGALVVTSKNAAPKEDLRTAKNAITGLLQAEHTKEVASLVKDLAEELRKGSTNFQLIERIADASDGMGAPELIGLFTTEFNRLKTSNQDSSYYNRLGLWGGDLRKTAEQSQPGAKKARAVANVMTTIHTAYYDAKGEKPPAMRKPVVNPNWQPYIDKYATEERG